MHGDLPTRKVRLPTSDAMSRAASSASNVSAGIRVGCTRESAAAWTEAYPEDAWMLTTCTCGVKPHVTVLLAADFERVCSKMASADALIATPRGDAHKHSQRVQVVSK